VWIDDAYKAENEGRHGKARVMVLPHSRKHPQIKDVYRWEPSRVVTPSGTALVIDQNNQGKPRDSEIESLFVRINLDFSIQADKRHM